MPIDVPLTLPSPRKEVANVLACRAFLSLALRMRYSNAPPLSDNFAVVT